jgi:hypothetical protein
MYVNNLSFDPAHPWFSVPGIDGAQWALEVFTTDNVYGIDAGQAQFAGNHLAASGLQLLGAQRQAPGAVQVDLHEDADGAVSWDVVVSTGELVKSAKLLLRHLPVGPTAAGWWTATTPAQQARRPTDREPVCFGYPWAGVGGGWQTPWICAGEGPAITLSVRDGSVRAKRFYAYRPHWADGEVIEIVCATAAASPGKVFQLPPVRLRACADQAEVKRDFDSHLAWLEASYGLPRWEARGDVPPWADQLDLVVTLHGQHWTGYVFNTFDQMAAILERVCQEVPGPRTLVYLPGWEGRYYWQYPTYRPGEDLGGEAAFRRLVATARRLGAHLMPMFGANCANIRHYPKWGEAAFRSPRDLYVELVNKPDWDNDRAGEDEQVFLNPGEPNFRGHLIAQVSETVERYGIEGVFLDTSACWFDDPRYDVYQGYRDLVGGLHARYPDLLVCGEGWYDALLGIFPMNQTWVDMADPPRFDDLPARYSRLLGHLNDGAPGSGSTGVHEGGTNRQARPLKRNAYVPALPFVDDTLSEHWPAVQAFCRAIVKEPL